MTNVVMLHYDFWQTAANFDNIEKSIKKVGENQILTQEMIETLEFLIDRISHIELDIDLPYSQPLKLHSRYTRDQILAAFGANTFQKQSSNREGLVNLESKNTELLLVTLEKTEDNYSLTYDGSSHPLPRPMFEACTGCTDPY